MMNFRSPLSYKFLIILFALFFSLFLIVNLPVSLIGKELNKNGVYFSDQYGTFWHGQFGQVLIMNTRWQSLALKPSFLSLFGQGLTFDFILKSADRLLQGKSTIQDDYLILNNVTIRSDIIYKQNGRSLNSTIGLEANEIVLEKNGQCQGDEFNIEMDFLNQFSDLMNIDFPLMKGTGVCQNGIVSINMGAAQNGIEASYLGEFVKNKQSGLLSIKLPAIMEENNQMTNILQQFGFEKTRDQWQANMEIGL